MNERRGDALGAGAVAADAGAVVDVAGAASAAGFAFDSEAALRVGLGSASGAALAAVAVAFFLVVLRFLAPDSEPDCSSTALVLFAIVLCSEGGIREGKGVVACRRVPRNQRIRARRDRL